MGKRNVKTIVALFLVFVMAAAMAGCCSQFFMLYIISGCILFGFLRILFCHLFIPNIFNHTYIYRNVHFLFVLYLFYHHDEPKLKHKIFSLQVYIRNPVFKYFQFPRPVQSPFSLQSQQLFH